MKNNAFLYTYNGLGALRSVTDTAAGAKTLFTYDTIGRQSETRKETGNDIFLTLYGYDTISRLNSLSYKYNGIYEHEYTTLYIADNRITSFKLSSGQNDIFTVNPVFDGLGRQTARTLKNGSGAQVDKKAYSFVAGAGGANASTSMIASVGYYGSDSTVDETYTYTYDNIGNIKTVSKNGTQIASYTYNSLNELTGYTDAAGTVHTYEYSDGNRLQYNERTALLYEDDVWLDRVTTIIDAETYDDFAVTYDAIGNTLSYRNGMSFTWKNGRQLATFTQGQTSASYNYNESGIRTDKTVNGTTTTYQLDGSKIVSENRNGNIIQYYYDETNSVIGLRYNGNDYFFRGNLQGDIIAILNTSGQTVVSYEYDPWGNILSVTGSMASTLGVANPFRYRSYYYDTESGLYYVTSRYYDPEIGRWISPEPNVYDGGFDDGAGPLSYDVYAYCANNPVNFSDPTGEFILAALIVGVVAGAIIGGAIGGTVAYNSAKSSGCEGSDLFWATAGGIGKGAVIGGIAGGLVGATCGVIPTYGVFSTATTAMVTTTLTMTAKVTEVTSLQIKKSINDGDNRWQIANDSLDTVFSNGVKIITPFFTKVATTSATYIATDIMKHKVIPLEFNAFLGSTRNKIIPYGFAVFAWGHTAYSVFCDDPISRANQRGYSLK